MTAVRNPNLDAAIGAPDPLAAYPAALVEAFALCLADGSAAAQLPQPARRARIETLRAQLSDGEP